MGVRVEAIVNAGELVDDETIFDIVKGKLENCDRFVLDGYPRTLAQAKQVSEFLKEIGKPLQAALYLDVSEDALYERITSTFSLISISSHHEIDAFIFPAVECITSHIIRPNRKEWMMKLVRNLCIVMMILRYDSFLSVGIYVC